MDQHKRGFITQDQFRAALENGFDVSLTDDQFLSFLDHVPLDKNGAIKYTNFMAQFDTRSVSGRTIDMIIITVMYYILIDVKFSGRSCTLMSQPTKSIKPSNIMKEILIFSKCSEISFLWVTTGRLQSVLE